MKNRYLQKPFSFYPNLKEARNYPMMLQELYQLITGDTYKLLTQTYRTHLANNELAAAKLLKSNLPCAMLSGQCKGMHNDRSMINPTDLTVYDVDGLAPGEAEILRQKAQELAYVALSFKTVSGGLKIVVLTPFDGWERHRTIYALIAAVLGNELNVQLDMSSDNPSRLSFVCCDQQAYYNPAATLFDWKGLELFPNRCAELLAQTDAWRKRGGGAKAPPLFLKEEQIPLNSQIPLNPQTPTPVSTPLGYIDQLITEFFHYNPWVKGQRNNLLLSLGRRLKRKGLNAAELQQSIQSVIQKYVEPDCDVRDITTRIEAGYNYADAPNLSPNFSSVLPPNSPPILPPNLPLFFTPNPQTFTMESIGGKVEEEDADTVEDINEEMRKRAPLLNDSVFSDLPSLLSRILKFSHTPRERDILLLSSLANLSAALPRVEFSYFNRMYTPHLFFLAIAKSAAGKGCTTMPPLLVRGIDAWLHGENLKSEKQYKEDLQVWELEKRTAQKEGRIPNVDIEPSEVVPRHLSIPANTSKNQIIISLDNNQPYGNLINSSELDFVTGAVNSDYGGHDVVFRQAFHAEALGSHFKVDKRLIWVEKPRLALCLTGTPNQALKFLPSQENGMASRMSIYFSHGESNFISAAPDPKRANIDEQFGEMAQEVLQNYFYLDKTPTQVLFTEQQWEKHTNFFNQRLKEVVADQKNDTTALVFRGGFVCMRIATILTALRKCEAKWQVCDITCTDEDFDVSLEITDTMLHHGLLFSTTQLPAKPVAKAGIGVFRMKTILCKMPTIFTFSELLLVAEVDGVPKSSAERYLGKMVTLKLLEKEDGKYRKTGNLWPPKTPIVKV